MAAERECGLADRKGDTADTAHLEHLVSASRFGFVIVEGLTRKIRQNLVIVVKLVEYLSET